MAEEQPSLHIDTDWKKQAQEEKRRLRKTSRSGAAERERSTAPSAPIPGAGWFHRIAHFSGRFDGKPGARTSRLSGVLAAPREIPEASFPTLVNSLMTQVLLYLGELTPRGVEPQVNLDMAKFNIDLLGVLEEKSKNNLSPDEQKLLDTALYETRMRYVQIASQYATV
jgi:hypothetical protein